MLPALALVGAWDSYLSFALYTGNTDTGTLVRSGTDLQMWSMEDLNAPAYPEERAYLHALRAACAHDPEEELVVRHRWSLLGPGATERFGCGDVGG